ncbi:MAG: hypothetical protein WAK31_06355 [Chthoniobacterales bacterium]
MSTSVTYRSKVKTDVRIELNPVSLDVKEVVIRLRDLPGGVAVSPTRPYAVSAVFSHRSRALPAIPAIPAIPALLVYR